MRIYSVTPIHVDETELARRQARYDQLSPSGVTIELHDIGPDAPSALNTTAEVRASESIVADSMWKAAQEGYDAVLPDCVLDPAVADLSRCLKVPVLGLLRLSVGQAVAMGQRVGAVTRNQAIADELVARVEAYGWADSFTGVEVLDLDVDAISDSARWDQALAGAVQRLESVGTSVVINGCSAVEVTSARVGGAHMVDPTALALRLVGAGLPT